MRQIMGSYYNFFSQAGQHAAFVVPYVDAFGLGLVTSACMPVHYQSTLVGVVCVDITVSDLLSDVTYFKEGELSYAFMIDDQARLRMHPLLPEPYTIEEDSIYVNMLSLESFQGADKVMKSMLRGDINQTSVSSRRVISRGKVLYEGVKTATVDSTYYWHPVEDTEFSVCLVIADADRRAVVKLDDFDQHFTYHRLDLKDESEVCNYYSILALRDSSTVQFSPEAFIDPYLYLSKDEIADDILNYEVYMTGKSKIDPGFKPGLRETVSVTAKLNNLWTRNQTRNQSQYVIWRYIGTEDGIFRVMPGSSQSKDYDHTRRPWYQRSLSQKGRLVLSTPYDDLLGAGYVLTLSKTVYEGRATGVHRPDDVGIGVIAIDFTLAFVFNRLSSLFTVCQDDPSRCFIIETSGFVVVHADFVKVDATKRPDVEYIHITEKEPHIAADLIKRNVMTKSACVNFKTQHDQYFWSVNITNGYTIVTGDYEVHEAPNTNVFLVIKHAGSSNDCECSHNKPHLGKCHQVFECECPCFVETNSYSYCRDFFNLTHSRPPCTPILPTLESDNSKEIELADSLEQCFNYNCTYKPTHTGCTDSATCSWCSVYKDGSSLTKPFCDDPVTCPYGVLDYSASSSSSSSSNIPAIIGGAAGALVLLLVIVFALCKWKKLRKAQPNAQDHTAQAGNSYNDINHSQHHIQSESQSTQSTPCSDVSTSTQDHSAQDPTPYETHYSHLDIQSENPDEQSLS